MRMFYSAVLAGLLAAVLMGCPETPPEQDPSLAVSTTDLRFAQGETVKYLQVWNKGGGKLYFDVTPSKTWIQVDPSLATSTGALDIASIKVTLLDVKAEFFEGDIQVEAPVGGSATVHVTAGPDYYTQDFAPDTFDLPLQSITFTPNDSYNFYAAEKAVSLTLPTNPEGGSDLLPFFTLTGDPAPIPLKDSKTVLLYGEAYDTVYVSSDGYVLFGAAAAAGRTGFSVASHFAIPGISGYYTNLDPTAGGEVSWRQLDDRVAITYLNVPLASGGLIGNTFQIELFFDGRIRLSYFLVQSAQAIVGLSSGAAPSTFVSSDLSSY